MWMYLCIWYGLLSLIHNHNLAFVFDFFAYELCLKKEIK